MLVKKAPTLSPDEVAALYDRIGTAQDTQVFYERPAVDLLIEHGAFADATTVLEVGCGTGRVAERLLRDAGPLETRYIGVDVSMRMVQIARDRLSAYEGRATVERTDGTFSFDVPTASQDRVVATYVLDVLAPEAIQQFFGEARRVLQADGRVCLAGLTWGTRPLGRLVSALWAAVHRLRPSWVGGCRPLHMCRALPADEWRVVHHERVQAWGVPSEVLIATPC
ncbi:MAG: class I SAM-dependent methyltransferase [Bacteroidetes bacterium SW_9_63_38]|nr:MAG: class I SAM-dependent methyltransferase [Bacteroidetes bacterium SW_9_63_38]